MSDANHPEKSDREKADAAELTLDEWEALTFEELFSASAESTRRQQARELAPPPTAEEREAAEQEEEPPVEDLASNRDDYPKY